MSTHDSNYDPAGEFDAVDTDIELVVEDTDLPRRLKTEVYREIDDRGLDVEAAQEVATAVESRYLDTRVDPLDPVGTVSAQSIGEPGTQMSIPGDEEILIRRDGDTDVTTIGSLVDGLASVRGSTSVDGHEVIPAPEGMEVPSLRADERVEWTPLEELSRHEAPDELLTFELESGRSIRATKAHSFVTRKDNEVVPVAGDDLEAGDWLPVVRSLDGGDQDSIDLREYLSTEDYWFTSALTDGGTTTLPGGDDQIRNKRDALEAGEIAAESVYPVQGTVGLPEELPLDKESGFFVGAFLAEGNLTDHYVSISNVDSEFQNRVRSFAERFDLSVNEYENESGFATGYDIRINGTVLADLLRAVATDDGEKVVPEFAFGASTAFVRGILAGYFSGDGSVSETALRASSTSEALIDGIGLLLARFDIYATFGTQDTSKTLRVPTKFVPAFEERIGMVGERGDSLEELASIVDPNGPDATDQIPNFGDALKEVASDAGIPARQVNSAHKRQRIGRNRLASIVDDIGDDVDSEQFDALKRAVGGDVVWDRIDSIERIEPDGKYVYDCSVAGLDTFTTAQGVVTHNTMNTFHYAGVAEIDVTQGLPRLIELVDARKEPDTPMMTVHLDEEHATDRERAHEVVWKIESTRILQLGDVSTNVADMVVGIELNPDTLAERWPTVSVEEAADEIESTIADTLGVDTRRSENVIEFGPDEPSYRELLQLVEELRDITFKGISDVSRVVIRKEETDHADRDEEFVLYTEGSALSEVLDIDGVDASRTTCNNIHEIYECLGIEAAREAIIDETMNTLEEQGLDDVNVRHLMLVADIMTNRGEIQSIGRHGISGNKDSVLARAAFEVTVSHLLDAAIQGEIDDLDGVTENVIVGKPIKLGTGDVNLRMGSSD